LLDNPAQRESLGQAARDFGVRTFGLDAMLDRMEAIFQDAAARV
jgi:hypothetical protein